MSHLPDSRPPGGFSSLEGAAGIVPALSLVVPLFNEASGIVPVVHSLQRTLRQARLSTQLILVNNGSQDETGDRLEELAAHDPSIECLHLPRNAGYGGGILAGLRQARSHVLGYLWGDEQVSHYAVVAAYRRLIDRGLDLCKARRVVRLDGWQRRLTTRTYHLLFPALFPVRSIDVHGCPKLFTRQAFDRLQPRSPDWFLDAEIMIRAHRLELKIEEIDVVAYPRETGRSKVRWSTLGEFAVNLVRYRIRPR
jgi:glycosyltransferase involved in cell wall biosynthesis